MQISEKIPIKFALAVVLFHRFFTLGFFAYFQSTRKRIYKHAYAHTLTHPCWNKEKEIYIYLVHIGNSIYICSCSCCCCWGSAVVIVVVVVESCRKY